MKKRGIILISLLLLISTTFIGCKNKAVILNDDIPIDVSNSNQENSVDNSIEEETAEIVEETEVVVEETEVVEEETEVIVEETEIVEETTEEVEVIEEDTYDPTVNISQPYDDVDYSPQDKETNFPNNPPINVKGLYITSHTAGLDRVNDIIELVNTTELNAIVIDVKDDSGSMLFYSEAANKYVPEANDRLEIKDINAFMKMMKDNNIYTIARIVTFKSPLYAERYPDKAITYKNSGGLYYADGAYWASPFDQELWQYNVEVAKEALAVGFNEIQFDYVRFPATGSKLDKNLDFKNPNGNSKTFAVQEFVKYARTELTPLEGYIALDVFGWTATTINDSGIGQHWEGMSNVADYLCPMVYPSHYGTGNFGLTVPDANPYETIYESISDAIERNANIKTPAKLRPWLQAFTATWVKGYIPYGKAEIKAQIKALEDLGIEDYIFWNASNKYNKNWFDGE